MHALPTAMVFEAPSGQVLRTAPFDPQLYRYAVIGLDASDVLYQVTAFDRREHVVHVRLEVFDEPESYVGYDRTDDGSVPSVAMLKSSDGVEIALHHLGGSGEPLLICHATGFHALAYAPLARCLASTFDVWAVDLRGHGASAAPASGDFSWQRMADDVSVAAQHIGEESLAAVGHSMGGAAILLAEAADPGLIRSAYLWEPIVFRGAQMDGAGSNPMSGKARKRRAVFRSKAEALDRYATRPPLSLLRLDSLAAYVEHGFRPMSDNAITLACEPEHEARTFEAPDKPTLRDLSGVVAPIAVVSGSEEPPGLPEQLAPEIADSTRSAEFRRHPHLGHLGPLQDPAFVGQDIIDVLGR